MLVAFNASGPTSLYTSKGGGPLALSRRSNSCVGPNGLALLRYSFRFRAYRPRPETHPLAGATIMDLTALADFNAAVHSVQDGYDLVIRVNPARTNC
jgi:hypothetical protein